MEIVVVRAFCLQGERQEVGASLDLPDALAREMLALGKASLPAVSQKDADPVVGAKPKRKPKEQAE